MPPRRTKWTRIEVSWRKLTASIPRAAGYHKEGAMAIRKFQVHYVIVWFLLLVLAQWRLNYPRTGLDVALGVTLQVLCFPMNIVIAVAIAFANQLTHGALGPKFFD